MPVTHFDTRYDHTRTAQHLINAVKGLAGHLTLMEAEGQRAEKRTDVQHHGYREALTSIGSHVTNSNSV